MARDDRGNSGKVRVMHKKCVGEWGCVGVRPTSTMTGRIALHFVSSQIAIRLNYEKLVSKRDSLPGFAKIQHFKS
jgi:hypothetical protein